MGWTGTYLPCCPRGTERMKRAIMQEVDENRVVDAMMVGTTVYLAMKGDNGDIFGAVILTEYGNHEFCTKAMSEYAGPYSYKCPKRILDKLSPTEDENAIEWRGKCRVLANERKETQRQKREADRKWREHYKAIFGTYPA